MLTGVNVPLSWFSEAASVLNCRTSTIPFVYLGLPRCEISNKIAWIKWNSVCLTVNKGGLGVRRLGEFNISLLGKWCWRLFVDKDGLWYRV